MIGFHVLDAAPKVLGSGHQTEAFPPIVARFVTYLVPALMQRVCQVAQRQREPDVKHRG